MIKVNSSDGNIASGSPNLATHPVSPTLLPHTYPHCGEHPIVISASYLLRPCPGPTGYCTPELSRRAGRTQLEESKMLGSESLNSKNK